MLDLAPALNSKAPIVINSFSPETLRALHTMNRAFAHAVIENHRFGLPMIQYIDGQVVETPSETLLPLAHCYLETNGEPLPEQVGGH